MAYVANSSYQIQLAGVPGYSELWTMVGELALPRETASFYDGKGEQITLLGIIKPDQVISIEKPFDDEKDAVLLKFHKIGKYPSRGLILSKTPKNTDGSLNFKMATKIEGAYITNITMPGADLNQTTPEVGRLVVSLQIRSITLGQS
jgi:hypothetical protein